MGEVLHEVDFNQLKIENQQYLEKIDEKNQDLLRLKLMDGNVQQILNTYKVSRNTGMDKMFITADIQCSAMCHIFWCTFVLTEKITHTDNGVIKIENGDWTEKRAALQDWCWNTDGWEGYKLTCLEK